MNQAQQIKQELNGETTVTLKYPVRLATGQTLDKVTVRRPRVGDLRAVMHIANEAAAQSRTAGGVRRYGVVVWLERE